MRLNIAALAHLLLASSATAWSIGSSSVSVQDGGTVPGKNMLHYCASPKDYILTIENVDLSPNPPKAGEDLEITASGTTDEDIEEGAKVHVQVKYGLITLIKTDFDLCDQAANVNITCPVKKGDMKLTKTVQLPGEIPPGRYTVLANVVTKDEKEITCLTAQIAFSRGKAMAAESAEEMDL